MRAFSKDIFKNYICKYLLEPDILTFISTCKTYYNMFSKLEIVRLIWYAKLYMRNDNFKLYRQAFNSGHLGKYTFMLNGWVNCDSCGCRINPSSKSYIEDFEKKGFLITYYGTNGHLYVHDKVQFLRVYRNWYERHMDKCPVINVEKRYINHRIVGSPFSFRPYTCKLKDLHVSLPVPFFQKGPNLGKLTLQCHRCKQEMKVTKGVNGCFECGIICYYCYKKKYKY